MFLDAITNDLAFRSEAGNILIGVGTGATNSTLSIINGSVGINKRTPSYTLDLTSTGGIRGAVGTTAQRPTAASGVFRYNTTIANHEGNDGTNWREMMLPVSTTVSGTSMTLAGANAQLNINASNGKLNLTDSQSAVSTITPMTITGNSTATVRIKIKNSNAGAAADTRLIIENNTGKAGGFYVGSSAVGSTTIYYADEDMYFMPGADAATGNTNIVGFLSGGYDLSNEKMRVTPTGVHVGGTANASRTFHVTGEARITDLTTDTPTRIVGADADGDISAVSEGYGINVTGGALEVDTTQIATQSDLAAISPTTLYTGDGTIATDRTVTIDDNYALITSGSPGVLSFTGTSGYVSSLSSYGYAYEIADTAFYITNATVKQPGSGSSIWYIQAGRQDATTFAVAEVNGDGGVTLGSVKTAGESSIVLDGQSVTHAADLSHITKIGATTIHTTTSTGVGINDTSPEKSLDVGGMGKFRQLSGQDNSVTIGTNANMGTGRSASITDSQSSDVAGRFSFTSGTGLTAGEWVTLTWAVAFDNPPAVQLFPEDGDGASLAGLIYVAPTTTGCSIAVNTNSASYESKTYEFNYIVIQGK